MGEIKNRIVSIDVVRGVVMIIMALDHVRDYFHISANTVNPLDLETTSPELFFTRWITHFCAPVFVFLSGTSIYLQGLRKSKKQLGIFLMSRGLWLVFAEFTFIALAWTFNPRYTFIPMQVIWAIGMSMLTMGVMFYFNVSYKLILTIGIIVVAGHNLLDRFESDPQYTSNIFWDLIHRGVFKGYEFLPGHFMVMVYPFPVWTGVMMLGYCLGIFFTEKFSGAVRKKRLIQIGSGLILLFIALRFTNVYGDPHDWSKQKNILFTFFSFIKVEKYPPSLLYLCIMIGPALILLAFTERINNWFSRTVSVFGRTPFFYYILHLYLIHLLAAISFFAKGHNFEEGFNVGRQFPFLFVAPGEGYGLPVVYLIWVLVIVLLYPLCKKYDAYKSKHKEKWWLSYI